MSWRICTLLALALLTTSGAGAQSPPGAALPPLPLGSRATEPDGLEAVLDSVRRERGLPAVAAAVVRGDRIVASGAVGVRRLGEPAEVSPGSRFHMGSLVKPMTMMLLGELIEEGRLSWSVTLADAFPELRDEMHPKYRGVTLEQLLQHRAGIAEFTRLGPEQARLFAGFQGSDVEQRRQFAAHLLRLEPVVEPGTEMRYSNAGYGLAAAVAEAATGRPWEEMIQERVLQPLGIRSAAFGSPPETGPDQPWGHEVQGGTFSPMPEQFPRNRAPLRPAGGISMSIEDLARFARAYTLALSGTETVLRPETARRLFGEVPPLIAGGNGYYTAMIALFPEQRVAVVAATNSGAERVLAETISAVRRRFAPETCDSPDCAPRQRG